MKLKTEVSPSMLSHVSLFRSFNHRELAKVARIVEPIEVHAGDHLCEQGDEGAWCFVFVDAEADVLVDGQLVGTVQPGEICGELSLLDGGKRAATVTITSGGTVLLLSRESFLRLLSDSPKLMGEILASFGHRLRVTNSWGAHGLTRGG